MVDEMLPVAEKSQKSAVRSVHGPLHKPQDTPLIVEVISRSNTVPVAVKLTQTSTAGEYISSPGAGSPKQLIIET